MVIRNQLNMISIKIERHNGRKQKGVYVMFYLKILKKKIITENDFIIFSVIVENIKKIKYN